jgi:HK97 family phage major capsid protein
MNRLAKFQAQHASIVAEMDALLEAAAGQELTADQKTQYDALEARRQGVAASVERERALREAERAVAIAGPEPLTPGAQPRARVHLRAEDDKRRRGFASHRDFLMAVLENSGLQSREDVSDERLRPLAVFDKDDKKAAGELAFLLPTAWTPRGLMATVSSDEQGEYDDSHGGFAVPTSMAPGLLQVGFEGDPTVGRTTNLPMSTPQVDMLARVDKDHTTSVSGGFTVARRAETVAATASRAEFEKVSLKAASLFGMAYATEEILADSPISFAALIAAGFSTQFGGHMLNEKVNGIGGDQYKGILKTLAASSLGPTISIAKEAGQVADTIVTANVTKARARCWGYGKAIWLANHDTYPQLAGLSIGIGAAGALVYQQSVVEDRPDMLLGRPIFYTEYAATIGDQGDIILANFAEYLEGLYQPLRSAESMHVRFANHERAFKFWLRNAGAPWWRAALTPAKSAATLSPFVVLDAR